MDITRQLKIASTTGKLLFGQRQAIDACAKGDAKCIVLAANCPQEYIDNLAAKHPEVTIHAYAEADHGFNCDHRGSYHETDAKLAQERTNAFVSQALQ